MKTHHPHPRHLTLHPPRHPPRSHPLHRNRYRSGYLPTPHLPLSLVPLSSWHFVQQPSGIHFSSSPGPQEYRRIAGIAGRALLGASASHRSTCPQDSQRSETPLLNERQLRKLESKPEASLKQTSEQSSSTVSRAFKRSGLHHVCTRHVDRGDGLTDVTVHLVLLLLCAVFEDILRRRCSPVQFCMKWPALWPTGLLALLIAGLDSHWLSSGSGHAFAEGAEWTSGRKLAVRFVQ